MDEQYTFDGQNGPVSPSVVDDLEATINSKLPYEYRKFLLETNGGEDFFTYVNSEIQLLEIGAFFGIGCDNADAIVWNFNVFSNRFNTELLLPIGSTSAGDIICLNLSDESISIWWHETETMKKLRCKNFRELWKDLDIEEI